MRRTATVLTLLLTLTAAAWSACPEAPAGSTYVGTMTVTTAKTAEVSATATAPKKEYSGEICIFRTATGETIYMVDMSTITSTDGSVSTMSEDDLEKAAKELLKAAKKEGRARGYENGHGIR